MFAEFQDPGGTDHAFFRPFSRKNCLKVEIGWIGLFTLFRLQKMDTMDTAQATKREVYPCAESLVKQFWPVGNDSGVRYLMTYGRHTENDSFLDGSGGSIL